MNGRSENNLCVIEAKDVNIIVNDITLGKVNPFFFQSSAIMHTFTVQFIVFQN